MALYAEFYTHSNKRTPNGWEEDPANPVPGLGDRSVIRIDGRLHMETAHAIAKEEATKRGYLGYRLHRGTILHPSYVSELIRVEVLPGSVPGWGVRK